MNNFLEFINNDIEAKKTLLSALPTNSKTNKKKYNEKIASIEKSYLKYKDGVLKYLQAKSDSFQGKPEKRNTEELQKQFDEYRHMKFILNPMNSFMEKIGFDDLLYDIRNYSNFTFDEINETIRKLIDKFKMCGIELKIDDFKYTYYVHQYMSEYLKCNGDYSKLSQVFEEIYWYNPNIIEHIELNFRKLIRKHQKTFESYISKEQKTLLHKNNFKNYDQFTKALKEKYDELVMSQEESIYDIIQLAKNNEIEINNYLPDSKFRQTTYSTLTIRKVDYEDPSQVEKVLNTLKRLRVNIVEYGYYLKYVPLFDYFQEKYGNENLKVDMTSLKNIEDQISKKEAKLDSIDNKIFGDKEGFLFKKPKGENLKDLKVESLKIAKELYDLYYQQDKINFENRVISLKNDSLLLISDVVRLYYSYSFFKKETFKTVFNLESYNEIVEMCDEFDSFASNPTNIIINGINTFEKIDVASIIVNKFRLENININTADLDEDSLDVLKNKIDFIFRINHIENSKLSVEKIWFIVQICKIIEKEEKEKEKNK